MIIRLCTVESYPHNLAFTLDLSVVPRSGEVVNCYDRSGDGQRHCLYVHSVAYDVPVSAEFGGATVQTGVTLLVEELDNFYVATAGFYRRGGNRDRVVWVGT